MQITPRTYVHGNRTASHPGDERKTEAAGGGLDVRGRGWDRKHKVAWKSLSFVESSVKGGGEADVRPHTDNSTECSVEFMRFNPLRNSREAAPPPSFPFNPHATGIYDGSRGWVRPGPSRRRGPHAGDAGFKVHGEENSRSRSPPHGERVGFNAGQ